MEIAVATTKAYSAQLIAGNLLSIQFAYAKGKLNEKRYKELIEALQKLPEQIQKVLDDEKSEFSGLLQNMQMRKMYFYRPRH